MYLCSAVVVQDFEGLSERPTLPGAGLESIHLGNQVE